MSFDSIPEDGCWATSCPECGVGNVSVNSSGDFECDNCDFYRKKKTEDV